MLLHRGRNRRIGQDGLDLIGQFVRVSRGEQSPGTRAFEDLGQSAGAGCHRGSPRRHGLECHDAKGLIQRGNRDTSGGGEKVTQLVIVDEPCEMYEVPEAFDIELDLEIRQVRASPGDDTADIRDPLPKAADGRGENLEALFVLDSPPGEHHRFPRPGAIRSPEFGIDPVGNEMDLLGWQFEAADDFAGHERRAADDFAGLIGEPPFDAVDHCGRARRHMASVPATFGGVDRGHEGNVEQVRQDVPRPCDQPVMGMDHLGAPRAQTGGELHQMMVRRGHLGDEVLRWDPGQIGAGSQDADSVHHRVLGGIGMMQRHHDDLVAVTDQRSGQTVDMSRDPSHHQRWILPRGHEYTHARHRSGRGPYAAGVLLGSTDLHLFNEGTHQRLWEVLGAIPDDAASVRFSVWAPNAREVAVVSDANGWDPRAHLLVPQGSSGIWAGVMEGARAGDHYKYVITTASGEAVWKADPMARQSERPPSDASVIAAPSRHVWSDAPWLEQRDSSPSGQRPMRIYEVHLGSWRPVAEGRAFADLAEGLARHVAGLGFTHVEVMPVAEHPFGGSWGYQVSGYYAPSARYGTPDDLRHFVDVMHAHGLGVILDWVPAHFPRDAWALGRFDGTALYEHADPRRGEHPDWGTYVFNYARHEVRSFLVSNAHYWFDEFHVDGLRIDAVASMLYLDYSRNAGEWEPNRYGGREDLDAVSLLRHINTTVLARHPGAVMMAEESTAWPGVTAPADSGGLGFTHKWNMGWMNDTLGYFSRDPVHRRWHHGELTFGLLYGFSETFVLPLSHDEVVHGKGSLLAKMPGDDWQRFANLRALWGWTFAHPGDLLVFMGSELAPWREWSELDGIDWGLGDHEPHRGHLSMFRHLGNLVSQWSALWAREHDPGGFQWLDADDEHHSVFAFIRWGVEGRDIVVCVANLTPVARRGYRLGVPFMSPPEVLVDTDDRRWGGGGERHGVPMVEAVPWQGQEASVVVDLAPLSVLWLGQRRG